MSNTLQTGMVVCAVFVHSSIGQIDFEGEVEAIASFNSGDERQQAPISTGSGTGSANITANFVDASANMIISTSVGAASSSITIVHTLDSGPLAVGGSASTGTIAFSLSADTEFAFTGLLEQQSEDAAGGGEVEITNADTNELWYRANPNFALPNRPIDFSEIFSSGVLPMGNYELSWFHAANHTAFTAQTLGFGDFTLTLSAMGCNATDLNADGMLDFFDVSAFLTAFGNMDPIADFNGDGLFNFFDVSEFLTAFGEGCP
jgi:hypothetical protein